MTKNRLRVTRGQYVSSEKLALARQFRKNPTPDEHILWNALKSDALVGLHFRRQQVISGFVVDFYCATAELAVELDGAVHAGQAEEDGNRDRALRSIGVRTLRIASPRVRSELTEVLAEICVACTKA